MNKKSLVIVRGGSAGWMAANMFLAKLPAAKWNIHLIESPDITTIGVGEGSTSHLKTFFDQIGINETQWMPACNATYKLGIRFNDWSTKPGYESYFHPFYSTLDKITEPHFLNRCINRQQHKSTPILPDDYFITAVLAQQNKGPKPAHHFPLKIDYGYHFDAGLLGQYLSGIATKKGVQHHSATVVNVNLNNHGEIASLLLNNDQKITGDFFIDCSGFAKLLISKALKVNFTSYKANLFNNAAITIATPPTQAIAPQTVSTAMKNGWRWHIPLTERTGNGYVYSNDFCSADQAETELRSSLGLLDSEINANHLKFEVGRQNVFWSKNCLAVGLSQGFIEPLEATSIATSFDTLNNFINIVLQEGSINYDEQTAFNQHLINIFEGTRDYVMCHFYMSSRRDSDYWCANVKNKNIPEGLRDILRYWYSEFDFRNLADQDIFSSYSISSWYSMLTGYGLFQENERFGKTGLNVKVKRTREQTLDFLNRCALNFESHEESLAKLRAKKITHKITIMLI